MGGDDCKMVVQYIRYIEDRIYRRAIASVRSTLRAELIITESKLMASAVPSSKEWLTESYAEQNHKIWPRQGRHILAQYDDDSVVVYQAYCPEIAEYAVKHQK